MLIGLVALAASAPLIVLATQPAPKQQPRPAPGYATGQPTGQAGTQAGTQAGAQAGAQATGQANGQTINVARLLPVDPRDLAAAADLARQFVVAYGTYRFDEPPQAYLDRIGPLLGEQLRAEMDANARNQALLRQRRRDRVVATADGRVRGIRHLDADAIDFLVTGHQHIATAAGESDDTTDFAVTLTKDKAADGDRDAGGWSVYAVQPATAGQNGDVPP
jgi:hypothetical protein